MILAAVNSMIGPWGRAILGFYFAHQTIINIIFLTWAALITYGSIQLNKVRHFTIDMAVDVLKKSPGLSNEQVWGKFRPLWQEELSKLKVPFVLNRWNLWIAKPTPDHLVSVLRLSPEWFGALRKGEVLPYRFSTQQKNDKLKNLKRGK